MMAHWSTFTFGCHKVTVACREGPQPLQGKSLTLQNEQEEQALRETGRKGGVVESAPNDTIGSDIWPAAISLCQYLVDKQQVLAPYLDHVIEIGAGTGLVGLLAVKLGSTNITLTDYEPQVLELVQQSIAANGVQGSCKVLRLDWRNPSEAVRPGAWQMVLAADVLYVSSAAQAVCNTIHTLLHPQGIALVSHQVRRAITIDPVSRIPVLEKDDKPLELFKECCSEAGLKLQEQLLSNGSCTESDDVIVLLTLTKPNNGTNR